MSETKIPRSPKLKDDLSAIFPDKETEAAFKAWWNAHTKKIDSFEKSESKTLLHAVSEFWYERVNEGWTETIDLVRQQRELLDQFQKLIPEAEERGEMAAVISNWDAIRGKEERLITLEAKARPAAIEKRREAADRNNATLDKAVSDLFARPESKGWRWTNDDIADFIAKNLPIYKRSTILQRVKTLAAKHRKEGK
jgi:hypothetical protein